METRPDLKDDPWEETTNGRILTNYNFPQYVIDNKIINEITLYNQKFVKSQRFKDTSFNEELVLMFIIKRKDKILYVGYTYRSLIDFLKINLSRKLDKDPSMFDEIKGKLVGLTIEGVEYLHKFNHEHILKKIKEYDTKTINTKIYWQLLNGIINLIDYKKKFAKRAVFIYVHQDVENNRKIVSASVGYNKPHETLNYFLQQHKIDNNNNFNLIESFKKNYVTLIEMYLFMDDLIIKHNTIKNGYNRGLKIIDLKMLEETNIRDKLYLLVNKDLLEEYFIDDDIEYDQIDGFLYELKDPNDRRYIGVSHNKTMKEIMIWLYKDVLKSNDNGSLKQLFIKFPFYLIKFQMLKIKYIDDPKIDLDTLCHKYIVKFDSIDSGYNDDDNNKNNNKNISKY